MSNLPLVAVLFPRTGFEGASITVITDEPDLDRRKFDKMLSSIVVYPGPSYAAYKLAHENQEPTITVFTSTNASGDGVKLQAGTYSTLQNLPNNPGVKNQTVSSLKFDAVNTLVIAPPDQPADPLLYSNVRLIVQTFESADYMGSYQVYVGKNMPSLTVATKRYGAATNFEVANGAIPKETFDRKADRDKFLDDLPSQTAFFFQPVNSVYMTDSTRNLNNAISSILISRGPNYYESAPANANFYDSDVGPSYTGTHSSLGVGQYPVLGAGALNLDNKISAILFP